MKKNFIDFGLKKKELESENKFLDLLDSDLSSERNVSKIPESVFDRVDSLKRKAALAKQRAELLEM